MFAYLFLQLLVFIHDKNWALINTKMGYWFLTEIPMPEKLGPAISTYGNGVESLAADGVTVIGQAAAAQALARLDVDPAGLDALDRRYLRALIENYGGGPAGVETLAYAIAEARDAVEDVIEPFLMQQGFIQRTPRGRLACAKAYLHVGLTPPPSPPGVVAQPGLFEDEA